MRALEGVGVLAGQDGRFRPHTMLDGIESGAVLARSGPGAGGLPGVAAVRFGALRRRLSVAHCRDPLRESRIEEQVFASARGLGEEFVESRGNWRMATLCAISIGTFWAVPWTFWEFFWKSGNLRREFRDFGID